jgi:hypothetical protein
VLRLWTIVAGYVWRNGSTRPDPHTNQNMATKRTTYWTLAASVIGGFGAVGGSADGRVSSSLHRQGIGEHQRQALIGDA